MPQTLSEEWRTALGPDHERIHKDYLYSPGDITLTGYNSQYGNYLFAYKRDTEGGFEQSPLRLNNDFGTIKEWNEDAITNRGRRLAQMAIKVWPFPY